jgi:hypothetical protein
MITQDEVAHGFADNYDSVRAENRLGWASPVRQGG